MRALWAALISDLGQSLIPTMLLSSLIPAMYIHHLWFQTCIFNHLWFLPCTSNQPFIALKWPAPFFWLVLPFLLPSLNLVVYVLTSAVAYQGPIFIRSLARQMQVTACHTCEAPSPPCLRCLPTKTAGPPCHNSLCRHSTSSRPFAIWASFDTLALF